MAFAPVTIELLERRMVRVESVLILLTIAAIATADFFVGRLNATTPLGRSRVRAAEAALEQEGVALGLRSGAP